MSQDETVDPNLVPDWLTPWPGVVTEVTELIGETDFRRLMQLLSDSGGLTPTEACE